MTRSIRLVVIVSSPVPSDDDETKMNVEKHECSLLKVVSDAGSTPAASTTYKIFLISTIAKPPRAGSSVGRRAPG